MWGEWDRVNCHSSELKWSSISFNLAVEIYPIQLSLFVSLWIRYSSECAFYAVLIWTWNKRASVPLCCDDHTGTTSRFTYTRAKHPPVYMTGDIRNNLIHHRLSSVHRIKFEMPIDTVDPFIIGIWLGWIHCCRCQRISESTAGIDGPRANGSSSIKHNFNA